MRDHGGNGRVVKDFKELGELIKKTQENPVIIPPPHEITTAQPHALTTTQETGVKTAPENDIHEAGQEDRDHIEFLKKLDERLTEMTTFGIISKEVADQRSKEVMDALSNGGLSGKETDFDTIITQGIPKKNPESTTPSQETVTPPPTEAAAPAEGQPATPETPQNLTPEQKTKFEGIMGKLKGLGDTNTERAKNLGAGLERFGKNLVEGYKTLPTHQKLILAGGLFALASAGAMAGGAAGTAIATAAFTGSLGQRMLGAASMYITLDAALERKTTAQGRDGRTETEKLRHKVLLGTFAALIGSGTLGIAAHNLAEMAGVIESSSTPAPTPKTAEAPKMNIQSTPTETAGATKESLSEAVRRGMTLNEHGVFEATQTPISPEITIKPGDTLWKVLGDKLAESGKFEGLSEAQKSYVIDSLKDKLEAMQSMSPEKIRDLGISSQDINALKVGETVNLSSILGDNELINKAVSSAKELTPDQVTNIQEGGTTINAQIPPEAGSFTGAEEIPPQAGDFTGENQIPEQAGDSTGEATTDNNPYGWGEWADPNSDKYIPNMTPAFEANALESTNKSVDELFGKKGFLGIGKVIGIESPHWTHPQTGFGNMNVETVLTSPSGPVNGIGTGVGISNNEAHTKIINLIEGVKTQSGINPTSGETVREYLNRANIEESLKQMYAKVVTQNGTLPFISSPEKYAAFRAQVLGR